jgi:hypothetical protein
MPFPGTWSGMLKKFGLAHDGGREHSRRDFPKIGATQNYASRTATISCVRGLTTTI